MDILASRKKIQRDLVLEIDGPNELVLSPTMLPESMKDIVNSVNDALNAPGTAEEKEVL